MPRKKSCRTSPVERRSDVEDDDFLFDDDSNHGRGTQEPQHRNAANARERARMRVLSKAFCRLKTTLPWVPADTKLSKLDTLRLAASYIAHLRSLLHDEPRSGSHMFPHPLNLAWPFAFQHGGTSTTTISQRWNPTSESPSHSINMSFNELNSRDHSQNCSINEDNYNRNYPENGYSEREFDDTNETQNYQFCSNHKNNYYDVRNNYSDSLMNV